MLSALIVATSGGRLEPQYLPPRPGGGGGGGVFGGGAGSGGGSGIGIFGGSGGGSGGSGGNPNYGGNGGANIPILRYENENNGDGTYHFRYALHEDLNHDFLATSV